MISAFWFVQLEMAAITKVNPPHVAGADKPALCMDERKVPMKKLLTILLCALMIANIQSPVRAASDQDFSLGSLWPMSMAQVGETFYYLTQDENRQVISTINLAGEQEQLLTLAEDEAISNLLSMDDKLFGLQVETGRLATITENGLAWQDQVLDLSAMTSGKYDIYSGGKPFLYDNLLFVSLTRMDAAMEFEAFPIDLLIIDIYSGAIQLHSFENIVFATPYKPGQLLLLGLTELSAGRFYWQLSTFTIDSSQIRPLPLAMPEAFPYNNDMAGLMYDRQMDRIYYADALQIMASDAQGPFERVGLLDFEYISVFTPGFTLPGAYALLHGDRLVIRNTDKIIPMTNLVIHGYLPQKGISQFRKDHPSILPLTRNQTLKSQDVYWRIQGGDDSADIYVVNVDSAFLALINKGYAKDLSGDKAIFDDVASMNPMVKQVLTDKDGRLFGYPLAFHGMVSTISKEHWQEIFQDKPYPKTWGQVMEARLQFAKEGPEGINFFAYMDNEMVIRYMLESYIIQYDREGRLFTFDFAPLKQALTEALEASNIRPDEPEQDWESESGGVDFIIALNGSALNFEVPGRYETDVQRLSPFAFEEGATPLARASLQAAIINPLSHNQEAAREMLISLTGQDYDPHRYYSLHPDAKEPYPDPDFDEKVKRIQEQLDYFRQLVEQGEKDPGSVSDLGFIRTRVEWAEADLADVDRLQWMIPMEGIQAYHEQAKYLVVPTNSPMLGDEPWQQVQTLVRQLNQGALTIDAFVKQLDDINRMVRLEME